MVNPPKPYPVSKIQENVVGGGAFHTEWYVTQRTVKFACVEEGLGTPINSFSQ